MNPKLAFKIIAYLSFPGKRRDLPFSVKEVWYKCYPNEKFPAENMHCPKPIEDNISYEVVREKLLEAAINYLSDKIK